jgi:hypothetical protein
MADARKTGIGGFLGSLAYREAEIDSALARRLSPPQAKDQGNDQQNDRDPEEDMSDFRRRARNTAEAKYPGDDGDNKKDQSPI